MRKMMLAACASMVGLLVLPACSKQESGAGAPVEAGKSVKAPKAGLWEISATVPGMPQAMKSKVCVGETAPGVNPFAPPSQAGQNCSKNSHSETATGYAFDMECTANGMTIAMHGDVEGDFSSAYQTKMSTKMSGPNIPAAMQKETVTTVAAKYLGNCPADMKPGQTG